MLVGIIKINIQAYADDIAVFCPTASVQRRLLITLENKLKQNELIVNVTNTKVLSFSKKKRHRLIPVFQNEWCEIRYCKQKQIFGMHFEQ